MARLGRTVSQGKTDPTFCSGSSSCAPNMRDDFYQLFLGSFPVLLFLVSQHAPAESVETTQQMQQFTFRWISLNCWWKQNRPWNRASELHLQRGYVFSTVDLWKCLDSIDNHKCEVSDFLSASTLFSMNLNQNLKTDRETCPWWNQNSPQRSFE